MSRACADLKPREDIALMSGGLAPRVVTSSGRSHPKNEWRGRPTAPQSPHIRKGLLSCWTGGSHLKARLGVAGCSVHVRHSQLSSHHIMVPIIDIERAVDVFY